MGACMSACADIWACECVDVWMSVCVFCVRPSLLPAIGPARLGHPFGRLPVSGGRGNMFQVPKLGSPVHRTDNKFKAMLKRCLQHGTNLKGLYLDLYRTVFDDTGVV